MEYPHARPVTPSPARLLIPAAAIAAIALPTLLAYNLAPSSTFLNQALSFAFWGWFLVATAGATPPTPTWRAATPPLAGLAVLAGAAAWSWGPGALPASLGLSALATLFATALVMLAGARAAATGGAAAAACHTAYAAGWLAAAVAGAAIAIVQVFAPQWTDGTLIAHSTLVGRAVGNLRQPNHLSSILLWGAVAVVALTETRRLNWRVAAPVGALLVFSVVLTASRTGLVSVLLLALWGLADSRLSRSTRWMLVIAPVVYYGSWEALSLWGQQGEHRFGGQERLAETDISGSRFGIWRDTLALIAQQPLTGVGFGEFNFAWSLTPFPGRPTAFFDHTHNLLLQFLVELGVPLGTLVILLLLWGLMRVALGAWREPGEAGAERRCAFVMLLMIGLHSMLEYPLWYAYFLLPTAWIWGYALVDRMSAAPSAGSRSGPGPVWSALAGLLLVVGAVASVYDYRRVTVIFGSRAGAAPLEQRIADGQRSWFFAHHADYAAATTPNMSRGDLLKPFARAPHYLLDTRLVTAWAQALEDTGRYDQARHLAQRLREFDNPLSADFFEPCEANAVPRPFQCDPPARPVSWRDFLKR